MTCSYNQDCSCISSDKYFSAARSFGDCAAFCAAQNFPHFQYGTADGAVGVCACCNLDATETSVGNTSVYTFAESKVQIDATETFLGTTSVYTSTESKVAESTAQTGSATGSAHPIVPYLLHAIFLPFIC